MEISICADDRTGVDLSGIRTLSTLKAGLQARLARLGRRAR